VKPHDPAVRPGAHLVAAELGVEDPWALTERHPLDDPLWIVGRLVATIAHEVDDLHDRLTRAARSAIDLLEPVNRGEHAGMRGSYGVLDTAVLAARRGAAYQHLTHTVSAYRRLLPEAGQTASDRLRPTLERAAEQAPRRDDDWAIAGDRQVQALRAVERGGLRLKQSALSEQDRYLSDGTGVLVPVWAQTVERMLADGLLNIDTGTAPTQGQLLSLTPLGQEALRAADDVVAAPATSPEHPSRDVTNPVHAMGSSDPAVDPLPTREELLALEEIKRGRVLLKERPFRPGLGIYTGSGVRISTATVEAMQERGWIERDARTSLNFGQQLSLTDSGETAFRAGCAQDPRTTAALSRSARSTHPSSPADVPAASASAADPAKPTRTR
jgi:DNA-binding MarR family transcriptional regulator